MIARLQLVQYLGQGRGAYIGQLILVILLTWWCCWSGMFGCVFVDRFQFNRRPCGNWSWLGRQLPPAWSPCWWFTRDVDIFGRNLDRFTGCGGRYVNGSPGCFVVGHGCHGMQTQCGLLLVVHWSTAGRQQVGQPWRRRRWCMLCIRRCGGDQYEGMLWCT